MTRSAAKRGRTARTISGVAGLDELTGGGLPRSRISVVLGAAGCGKTIFALQGLAAGASAREPGLFVAFEESPDHLIEDTAMFSWSPVLRSGDGVEMIDARLSQAIVRGGDFDVVGLLAILGARVKALGVQRVIFDGLDALLVHLAEPARIRREILRIREWVYETGVTGIMTAKATDDGKPLADYEFLEFAADCVISLRHGLVGGVASRTLQVAKYRGKSHSANELPFTITKGGIEVSSAPTVLEHAVSKARVTSGSGSLDAMLGGGYYRGSSVLISGAPGTSKTSLAASFARAACLRKERTVYVSFDEAPDQIVRNVASIGIDLAPHIASGMLAMISLRARLENPEEHVARIRTALAEHRAKNLVIDPLSAFAHQRASGAGESAAVELLDLAKRAGVTSVCTSLLASAAPLSEETPLGVSTIADTWIHVSYVVLGGERNRALTIVKSRGTAHSNQVRELSLSRDGIELAKPYVSSGEVLMGSLRWERENEQRHEREAYLAEAEEAQKQAELAVDDARARMMAARTEKRSREIALERIVATRARELGDQGSEDAERLARRGGRLGAASAGPPGRRKRGARAR